MKRLPKIEAVWLRSSGYDGIESTNLSVLIKIAGESGWREAIDVHLPHDQTISHIAEAHAYERWEVDNLTKPT